MRRSNAVRFTAFPCGSAVLRAWPFLTDERFSVIVIPTFSTSDKFSVDFYQSIKKYIVSTRVGAPWTLPLACVSTCRGTWVPHAVATC